MIYFCDKCGAFVPEDEASREDHSEYHSEVDTRCYEEWSTYHCPECGAELTEEADTCRCGEPKNPNHTLCENCYETVKSAWFKMVEDLVKELDDADAENYVLDFIEGVF